MGLQARRLAARRAGLFLVGIFFFLRRRFVCAVLDRQVTAVTPAPNAKQRVRTFCFFTEGDGVFGVANGFVVNFQDHIAGTQAGFVRFAVGINVGNDGAFDSARNFELRTHARIEVIHRDAFERFVVFAGLGWFAVFVRSHVAIRQFSEFQFESFFFAFAKDFDGRFGAG